MYLTPFGRRPLNQLEKQKIENTEKTTNDLRAASAYGSMNIQFNLNTKRPFTPYRPVDYNYYIKLRNKYLISGLSLEQFKERSQLLAPIQKHATFVSRGAPKQPFVFGVGHIRPEHPTNRRKRGRNGGQLLRNLAGNNDGFVRGGAAKNPRMT